MTDKEIKKAAKAYAAQTTSKCTKEEFKQVQEDFEEGAKWARHAYENAIQEAAVVREIRYRVSLLHK